MNRQCPKGQVSKLELSPLISVLMLRNYWRSPNNFDSLPYMIKLELILKNYLVISSAKKFLWKALSKYFPLGILYNTNSGCLIRNYRNWYLKVYNLICIINEFRIINTIDQRIHRAIFIFQFDMNMLQNNYWNSNSRVTHDKSKSLREWVFSVYLILVL